MSAKTSFDEWTDVVVVGYGFAGGIAAISAADAGSDVLLLEKMAVPGGISICSGGGFRVASDAAKALEYLVATNAGSIDLALLPINGRDPKRGVAGNLSGSEAAQIAKKINAGLVIPCHYDMFTFNTVSTAEFVRAAQILQQPYRVLQCGERLDLA